MSNSLNQNILFSSHLVKKDHGRSPHPSLFEVFHSQQKLSSVLCQVPGKKLLTALSGVQYFWVYFCSSWHTSNADHRPFCLHIIEMRFIGVSADY